MAFKSAVVESVCMRASRRASAYRAAAAAVSCTLALTATGCGDEQDVIALEPVHLEMLEDEVLQGDLSLTGARVYWVAEQSAAGEVSIDQGSGRFTFVPKPDFFGETTFAYSVRSSANALGLGVVSITVNGVNDPPQIAKMGDIENSADTFVQAVQIDPRDVDGDVTRFSTTTEQTDIAGFALDHRTGKLEIFPKSEGVAVFRVTAADDEYLDEEEFRFIVKRVTRRDLVPPETLAEEIVAVSNPLEQSVQFHLNVNDQLFPGSITDILERLRSQAVPTADNAIGKTADPSLIKAVWAGLVSSVSRGYTFTESRWVHDPVILLNSVGAAYCDDFASAFYALMHEAGYPARVWTLNGHVVPEVFEDDAWRLYDPDVGVYYQRSDGAIAGVEDLAASPDLITTPVGGEYLAQRVGESAPYSGEIADIYSSTEDNLVWDWYMTLPEERAFEIQLPPGASLAFPGGWKVPLPDVAGRLPTHYANLKVTMPGGWAGTFAVPLILVDVKGQGTISIKEQEFTIGSPELEAALASRDEFIEGVSIERADTDIELIYLINPRIISGDNSYLVELEGVQVAALQLDRVVLEPEHTLRD